MFIRSLHSVSALLARRLKPPLCMLAYLLSLSPLKAVSLGLKWMPTLCCKINGPSAAHLALDDIDLAAGVVCIAGEDAGTVQKLFEGSARHMIQRQIEKAERSSFQALETLLRLSKETCFFRSSVLSEILDQKGMPDVGALYTGPYGDQYGWRLTILSLMEVLSKIEVEPFGNSEIFVATIEAYKEALPMVKLVDELYAPTVCSKETYSKACASLWLSLLKKSRSQQKVTRKIQDVNVVVGNMDVMLEGAMRQLKERTVEFPWAMEVVRAYTMYTVCQNLRRWCSDVESAGIGNEVQHGATSLAQHIRFLLAEVLAGCISTLPAVLEARLSTAVESGEVADIENAILLIRQGQQVWEKLDWSVYETGLHSGSAFSFSLGQYWLQHKASDIDAAVQRSMAGLLKSFSSHL